MKKIIFALTFLISASTTFSQQNKLNIGIDGGLNLNTLYGFKFIIPSIKKELSPGLSTGIYAQYNLPKIFSFIGELAYVSKGAVTKVPVTDAYGNSKGIFKSKDILNYISVPLFARATFGGKIRFFVEAGVFASFRLNAKNKIIDSPIVLNYYSSDIGYEYKKFDCGAAAGVGASIPVSKKILISLEFRDYLGLYSINALSPSTVKIKTHSAAILVGIAYKLKPRA